MIKVENLKIENISPGKRLEISFFKVLALQKNNMTYALWEYKMIPYSHDSNIIQKS